MIKPSLWKLVGVPMALNDGDSYCTSAIQSGLLCDGFGTYVDEQNCVFLCYHLVTPSGKYFVDGLLASCYVAHIPRSAFRVVTNYFRLRFFLGVPILAEGLLPLYWFLDLMGALSVPDHVQKSLLCWPVVTATAVATELVNLLVTKSAALATSFGALAFASVKWRRSEHTENRLE